MGGVSGTPFAGHYQVTYVTHLTTTIEVAVLDESGNPGPIVIKPYKDIYRSSFTVQ